MSLKFGILLPVVCLNPDQSLYCFLRQTNLQGLKAIYLEIVMHLVL